MRLVQGITVHQIRGKISSGQLSPAQGEEDDFGMDWVQKNEAIVAAADREGVPNGELKCEKVGSTSMYRCNASAVARARLGPKRHSFQHNKIWSPGKSTNLFQMVQSQFRVTYPFGSGYHYQLDVNLTRDEAAVALEELIKSPFFDHNSRMTYAVRRRPARAEGRVHCR